MAVASGVRYFRILLIRWNWKFADLQRDCTWGMRDISLSNMTPRFRAEVVGRTSVSTLSDVCAEGVVLFLLAILMNSVLLPLSLSLFTNIHCLISWIHCSNLLMARLGDAGSLWSNDKYNCVSSAYRWNDRLSFLAISPRGRV